MIKNLKNTVPLTYVIEDLNGEEIVGTFYEKELQKINQAKLRVEKVIKIIVDKLYVKWKGYNDFLTVGERHIHSNNKKKEVELDFYNYAKKSDLKNSTGVDTSDFS